MLESMRRRDLIVIVLLLTIAGYSWHRLQPPLIDESGLTVTTEILSAFSPWHGPIARAQAEEHDQKMVNQVDSRHTDGEVKGTSTESAIQIPQSLLPVEEYYGSPFLETVDEMLKELGVTVYPEDIIEVFSPGTHLGARIRIYRATPVEVTDWGKKKNYRTWQKSVGDFLEEQGIELGDNDKIEPGVKSALTIVDGKASLIITRVEITEVKVNEEIAFKTVTKEDPELPRGQKKTTPGSVGKRVKTYRVTRSNGVETKRELIKNEVTKEPVDALTIIGTKVIYGETHVGRISWYKYDSTKVASDLYKRGVELEITNLKTGKQIIVKNDGCICSDSGFIVDLHPDYFKALGGELRQGVLTNMQVREIKGPSS